MKFKAILLFLIIAFFSGGQVFAADPVLTIECALNDCTKGSDYCSLNSTNAGSYLFNEGNIAPGQTVKRSLEVKNTGSCDCSAINLMVKNGTTGRIDLEESLPLPTDISSRFFTTIINGATNYYGLNSGDDATNNKTFNDIFNLVSPIILGELNAGKSKTFDWLVTFDPAVDNAYQGVKTGFDFDLEVRCGTGPLSTDGGGKDKNPKIVRNRNNNNRGGGETAGAATLGAYNQLLAYVGNLGDTLGMNKESSESPEEPTIPTIPVEAVQGAANKICEVSGLLWLVFVAQFLLHIIAKFLFKTRKTFYIAQLLILAAFISAFFLAFCVWWDVLVSLLIGIAALWFIKLFSD